ncbi:hypothetical protein GH714_041686 [Hevea brasiliensis]|uniref:Exostosin GT47 domain-containing protein n=1 Tax=Hevea brasiliensis TaxID=3981 RepID=A0A6A6MUT4_HEVBR|nr:hypothetical protein GH714_041686 [Hevea brasiliensis]
MQTDPPRKPLLRCRPLFFYSILCITLSLILPYVYSQRESFSFEFFAPLEPEISDEVFHSPEAFKKDYVEMEKNSRSFCTQIVSRMGTSVIIQRSLPGVATEQVPLLVKNSIRVVCSPIYGSEYIPHKDVSFPQIFMPLPTLYEKHGDHIHNRNILGFWAGRRNSNIRDTLVRLWQNDNELNIQHNFINRAHKGHFKYQEKFYRSKFCMCPRGSSINGGRISLAIHYGCVPVILSDYLDLPFSDILNWQKFSVIVKEKDVYNLKKILQDIPDEEYRTLQKNTIKVQKHFQWNTPAVRLDTFHMAMYELWLRRHVISVREWKILQGSRACDSYDFFFSGHNVASETSKQLGARTNLLTVDSIPGLNTNGLSIVRIDYEANGGLNPPHHHPRASEILTVLEGTLYAGFITSSLIIVFSAKF